MCVYCVQAYSVCGWVDELVCVVCSNAYAGVRYPFY